MPKGHLLQEGLGFSVFPNSLISLSNFMLPSFRLFLSRLASILIARSGGFDLGSVDVGRSADVVGLFHEEKQEDEDEREEDGGPVEDPLPTLILGEEAANDGCEVVASGESEGVDAYVCTALMGEVLKNDELGSYN